MAAGSTSRVNGSTPDSRAKRECFASIKTPEKHSDVYAKRSLGEIYIYIYLDLPGAPNFRPGAKGSKFLTPKQKTAPGQKTAPCVRLRPDALSYVAAHSGHHGYK